MSDRIYHRGGQASRPTIADVARGAGVGVATVDRVLNRRAPVRRDTAERVLGAAEAIGYHATGLLKRRVEEAKLERSFGFLLQRRGDAFYQGLAAALAEATRVAPGLTGRAIVDFVDEITPAHVAERLLELGSRVDAVALVAADHPRVSAAVDSLATAGKPVVALLSDLTAAGRAGFVGIDHRKAGRTAAWAIARLSRGPGAVAILVGSHRYLGHELCEASFRSYFREHGPGFRLTEALASFEDPNFAHEATLDILRRTPDLAGLYVAGGGMEGVISALREAGGYDRIVTVCNELVPKTRAALLDGVVDLVIATPVGLLAERVVAMMTAATGDRRSGFETHRLLPFEPYVSENV